MDNSEGVKSKQPKVLSRLLYYMIPHGKEISFAFFLLGLSTLGEVAGPYLIKIFIDDYIAPRNMDPHGITVLALSYFFIQLVNVTVMYLQSVQFQSVALKIVQQLRVEVFTKVQSLGMKFFDLTPVGSIVSRITNDTEAIKQMFVSVLAVFIQSIFLFIAIFIAMFFLEPRLATLFLFILPILYLIVRCYQKLSSKFYSEIREYLSQLNTQMNESLQGMSIIQVYGQQKRLLKRFESINESHYQAGMKNIKIDGALLRPAVDLVSTLAIVIFISYFGINLSGSTIEVGVIFAFISYLNRLFEPVTNSMQQLTYYQQAMVSASRVFALLDNRQLSPKQTVASKAQIEKGKVELKDISFSYDGKQDVLKNVSFTVNPGETVALVGHTGSGKSTIINLLMRFYEYTKGDILIDGKSIKSYPMEELRKKIGLVLQEPFMFYGTVNENIRLYNDEITDENIVEAAHFVQAHTFIEKLPRSYHEQMTERGLTFSSGQRQLIAFARAIVTNPQILILDEATANVDTETEEYIQQALKKMRKGRTSLVIAHRLSTIQDADLILVMHKGEIVERGTHQELLENRKLYHKMYLLQNNIN